MSNFSRSNVCILPNGGIQLITQFPLTSFKIIKFLPPLPTMKMQVPLSSRFNFLHPLGMLYGVAYETIFLVYFFTDLNFCRKNPYGS